MGKTRIIIVIDDLNQNVKEILNGINDASCSNNAVEFEFEGFTEHIEGNQTDGTTKLLEEYLTSRYDDISLFVVDHELSRKGRIVTDAVFVEIAEAIGVPVVRYHRAMKPSSDTIYSAQKEHMSSIKLDFDARLGEFACKISEGFDLLRDKFESLQDNISRHKPASILASLLDAPGVELELEQYLTARDIFIPQNNHDQRANRQLTTRLGYWLHNVILKYPGLILNTVATASYLGIQPEDFNQDEVKGCFQDAIYTGPFDGVDNFWWRVKLDQILDGLDGPEYVESIAEITVSECKCSVTGTSPAGYYDIITKQPISYNESVGDMQWIPPGADLTRINKQTYEEEAPLK